MGGGACQIIITNGNIAYGYLEQFANNNPSIDTTILEGALNASCQATLHASLYLQAEDDYYKLTTEYTQPIIDVHDAIINDLPNFSGTEGQKQSLINSYADDLIAAARALGDLF